MTRIGTRLALLTLGLASIAAPALAQAERQVLAPVYVGPGYVHPGPFYAGPVYPGPVYPGPVYPTPIYRAPGVAFAPILDRDTIEDRLDDQGYDDIEIGELQGGTYLVRAEDREDRKVWLRVDATTGYVLGVQYRRR